MKKTTAIRNKQINVRLTEEQLNLLKDASKSSDMSVSEYVLGLMDQELDSKPDLSDVLTFQNNIYDILSSIDGRLREIENMLKED